ncbi:MAG: hypothetical protein QOI54_817 [Actinomycetota bacterium]|nr:hypothetical protein [Actinomycetota bacterium]
MPAHDSRTGTAGSAPGPARSGPRDRIAALLPARMSLPARAYVGNSREPELSALNRFVRRGDTVIDIGAHKGIYTYWLRRQVGRDGSVLAYEPQPSLHGYLDRGLSSRWYRNVTLSDIALSDHAGSATLRIPVVSGEQQIAWASLESGTGDGPGSGVDVSVRTATLDDEIGVRPVSFIKCDVEGHELKVLRGSSGVLARQRPVWLVEVEHRHAGEDVAEVLKVFADNGYEPSYLATSGDLVSVPEEDRLPERLNAVEPGRYVNNFFFVPR